MDLLLHVLAIPKEGDPLLPIHPLTAELLVDPTGRVAVVYQDLNMPVWRGVCVQTGVCDLDSHHSNSLSEAPNSAAARYEQSYAERRIDIEKSL